MPQDPSHRGHVPPPEEPWRWLASTEALQREAYGADPDATRGSVQAQAESLKWNALAAFVELGEATREFSWKHWASDGPFVNRDRLLGELVDIAHFMGNMLIAVGVTDDEWAAAYQAKQAVNRARQHDGYTARKERA
jgi:dimeric dUTPase (all-alpha-NTP-PPase superfamily)